MHVAKGIVYRSSLFASVTSQTLYFYAEKEVSLAGLYQKETN